MPIGVSIIVDDRASKKLEQLGISMSQIQQRIIDEAAEVFLKTAQETCPSPTSVYYPTESTGRLRDSHAIQDIPGGKMVVATAPYALYVHEGHFVVGGRFGTRIPGERQTGRPRSYEFVAARPWMIMAVQYGKTEVEEMAITKVREALDLAALKHD